jgi:hypothetical protein
MLHQECNNCQMACQNQTELHILSTYHLRFYTIQGAWMHAINKNVQGRTGNDNDEYTVG